MTEFLNKFRKPNFWPISPFFLIFFLSIDNFSKKPDSCWILENKWSNSRKTSSKTFHGKHPSFQEKTQTEQQKYFSAKIVKNYNYFSKVFCIRPLTGFWICLFLNNCSLTCRLSLHYVLYDRYSEPCLLS